jgi:hypothetical protein
MLLSRTSTCKRVAPGLVELKIPPREGEARGGGAWRIAMLRRPQTRLRPNAQARARRYRHDQ